MLNVLYCIYNSFTIQQNTYMLGSYCKNPIKEVNSQLKRENIETKRLLEKILCVLKLANNKALLKEKDKILRTEIKRKIYELCDGKHTVSDIASELKTTQPNVSYHLSSLLESGLVLFDEIAGKRYYFKSLE